MEELSKELDATRAQRDDALQRFEVLKQTLVDVQGRVQIVLDN